MNTFCLTGPGIDIDGNTICIDGKIHVFPSEDVAREVHGVMVRHWWETGIVIAPEQALREVCK